MFNFCAQSAEELLKFVEDLKESIAEVSEMEQIRIECEYPPHPRGGDLPHGQSRVSGCGLRVNGSGKGVHMWDGDSEGRSAQKYLAGVLTATPPTAQQGNTIPRLFGTLEASPGSFSGPELECLERSAADKPTFSQRDWK